MPLLNIENWVWNFFFFLLGIKAIFSGLNINIQLHFFSCYKILKGEDLYNSMSRTDSTLIKMGRQAE